MNKIIRFLDFIHFWTHLQSALNKIKQKLEEQSETIETEYQRRIFLTRYHERLLKKLEKIENIHDKIMFDVPLPEEDSTTGPKSFTAHRN